MFFKHRLFSIALPMLRRCPSREMSPKESRMESKFMNPGADALLVDKGLKNKWRWAWIEEIGKDSKTFGSWCNYEVKRSRCLLLHFVLEKDTICNDPEKS